MSDTKLKPCPFCGSEAEMVKGHSTQYPFIYFAICKKEDCRASVGIMSNTREGAIKQWNTRKPMDRIIGKLIDEIANPDKNYRAGIHKAIEIVKGDDENE